MSKNRSFFRPKTWFALLLTTAVCWTSAVRASRPGWHRKEVDWRMPGGSRAKAIYYPADKPPLTLAEHRRRQPKVRLKEIAPSTVSALGESATEAVFAAVIDSPPINGFVPWIVVSVTDEAGGFWDIDAVPRTEVVGNYLTNNPESDYAIGIFDTGASVHIISDDDAFKTGIYDYDPNLVTHQPVELLGATGTATGYASQPLGIFIGGLDILEPNGLLMDDSNMVGETNVSIIVGDPVESPNLPTAVGIPLAVYFSTAFCNNKQVSVTIDGNDFNSPYIKFYELGDLSVPTYSNGINLELRPTDADKVQYFPCDLLGVCDDDPEGSPAIPSTIWGAASNQSLYFLPIIHLGDANESVTSEHRFMFDTGAQVTVIGTTMAAGLRLDLQKPEFPVEIQDVTGQVTIELGFYIDSLDIVASGQWLEYTNVPVVVLDVQSPEGDILDGIIGMNLFVDLNFMVKGGGMSTQGHIPRLEFEPVCDVPGDIAPACGDCEVDHLDLGELCAHWLETSASPNWNSAADLAPPSSPDEQVNFLDYAVLAEHWLEGTTP